jgi:flagellar basal body-associated protein FliL
MSRGKKGVSQFAIIMLVLSIVAVLLGVGVFYWLGKMESSANGNTPSMSTGKYKSNPVN